MCFPLDWSYGWLSLIKNNERGLPPQSWTTATRISPASHRPAGCYRATAEWGIGLLHTCHDRAENDFSQSDWCSPISLRLTDRVVGAERATEATALLRPYFSLFFYSTIQILAAPAVASRQAALASDLPKTRVVARIAAMRTCFANLRHH
jgi:hypothetical protein